MLAQGIHFTCDISTFVKSKRFEEIVKEENLFDSIHTRLGHNGETRNRETQLRHIAYGKAAELFILATDKNFIKLTPESTTEYLKDHVGYSTLINGRWKYHDLIHIPTNSIVEVKAFIPGFCDYEKPRGFSLREVIKLSKEKRVFFNDHIIVFARRDNDYTLHRIISIDSVKGL